jgi:flavin reductase (DIM6/NTAB) family NADH-FMN oxidoreductase RutF
MKGRPNMDKKFTMIQPDQITDNIFKLIGTDWMLITAGTTDKYNTMTASWGGVGVLWNKNVCFCFVRPQRYTYEFMESQETFTLSFFDSQYRSMLNYCGSKSGRDVNKAAETGITPVEGQNGTIYFHEARLVVECKKLYFQDINPENFLLDELHKNYVNKDYHRMYVGEITGCYIK